MHVTAYIWTHISVYVCVYACMLRRTYVCPFILKNESIVYDTNAMNLIIVTCCTLFISFNQSTGDSSMGHSSSWKYELYFASKGFLLDTFIPRAVLKNLISEQWYNWTLITKIGKLWFVWNYSSCGILSSNSLLGNHGCFCCTVVIF